jgi:hypothetical protein
MNVLTVYLFRQWFDRGKGRTSERDLASRHNRDNLEICKKIHRLLETRGDFLFLS